MRTMITMTVVWFLAGLLLAVVLRVTPFDTVLMAPVALAPVYFGAVAFLVLGIGVLFGWPLAGVPLGLGLGFGIAAWAIIIVLGG